MKKRAKRPPLTKEQKEAKELVRKAMNLPAAAGNRGQPPIKFDEKYLENLAVELTNWAKKDDSFFITAFCADHPDDLNRDVFVTFPGRSAVFDIAFSKVKERLVNRVRVAAMQKKLDGNFVSKILPLIDKEYKDWRIQELGLEAANSQAQAINVHIIPEKGYEPKIIDVNPVLQERKNV